MGKIPQEDRHTSEQLSTFTPEEGELLVDTTLGAVVVGDGVTKGGNPAARANGPSVFAYLSEEADTTVVTANTYYPIAGVFVNNPVKCFEATEDDSIKYTGKGQVYFEIDWHASFSVAPANANVKFGIEKNDVLHDPSVMTSYAAAVKLQASGTTVVMLEENDEIRLVCTSDADADVLTISNFTTTIRCFSHG